MGFYVDETKPPYGKKKLPGRFLEKKFLRSLIPYQQRVNINAPNTMGFYVDETKPPYGKKKLPGRVLEKKFLRSLISY